MKNIITTILKLLVAFFICALGITCIINANIGLSPWEVLHQGISKHTDITIGNVSILAGCIIVIIDIILGEKLGWATILNMISVGFFTDIILHLKILPSSSNFILSLFMTITGTLFMCIGTTLYLRHGLGSGPRDGLMIAIQKRTKKPVKLIRGLIECVALIIGYILGGSVGLGTLIAAILTGYVLQLVFHIFKFKPENIVHRSISDDLNKLIMKNKKLSGNR